MLTARKATLGSHVSTVLMTPFILWIALLVVQWPRLLIAGIILAATFWFGAPPVIPAINWEIVPFILGGIVFFWGLALLMTIYDHLRYQGWETTSNPAIHAAAHTFASAFLSEDFSIAYGQCSRPFQSRCPLTEFERRARMVLDQIGTDRTILQLDRPGFFQLPILQGAAGTLNEVADADTDAVTLVLLSAEEQDVIRRAKRFCTLRLRLLRDFESWGVSGFDATETSLNQA